MRVLLPWSHRQGALHVAPIVLNLVQGLIALSLIILALSSPRRPGVFFDGNVVDGQYTVSLVRRLTFSWVSDIMRRARNTTSLHMPDLPILHQAMRSDHLRRQLGSVEKGSALWKTIYFAHHAVFTQHYALSIVQSAAQFAPQFSLYHLLRILEIRNSTSKTQNYAWVWAVGLGASMLVAAWLETQLLWMVWTRLVITIRSELTALIYAKTLRKKDVKSAPTALCDDSGSLSADHESPLSSLENERSESTLASETNKEKNELSNIAQLSRQNAVNLISLDTKRVTDFVDVSFLIPASAFKLAISMVFLCNLIGWQSILSGLAAISLLTPFNIVFSRLMSSVQIRLMRTRDEKISATKEALHGIRQIKFTASEPQWLDRIGRKRQQELDLQWSSFLLRTALVSLWQLGPILLSAVSLAVYTILHGNLSPSVAFTTIAVFGEIDGSLAIIPKLIVQMLQARVSTERIGEYLNAPENSQYLDQADHISLRAASITWPTDDRKTQADFALKNLDLSFPTKKLSVVSGATGSGKSLLLHALIGEAEKKSGTVAFPSVNSDTSSHNMMPNNWIIDGAVAYVAQNPWIENTSIKNNILFGLPDHPSRYGETIAACALSKDLEMLPDGDATDIGVGGINLSGGQKWRISFARALYSRAGILIMDDIFSAVDAHVGAHMYKNALTGTLAQGRTRIIATHHIDLCLPLAEYFVKLGHGSVTDAQCMHEFTNGLDSSTTASVKVEDEVAGSRDSLIEHDYHKPVVLGDSNSSTLESGLIDNSCIQRDIPVAGVPTKKFVADEEREVGSVKIKTYRAYLSSTGGVWMLVIVLFTHMGHIASILGRVSALTV